MSGAARPVLPSRDRLGAATASLIQAGGATKAAIRLCESDGRRFVVKDVRGMHPLVRWLYGRRVLRREERALRALAGVAGVPALLGRIDADALALEFIAAEPIRRDLEPARLKRACGRLRERIERLHERGVVHLDLRQKRNVLVDAAGEVFLVDFQSAWLLAPGGFWMRRLAPLDRSAELKFRWRYAPELLSEEERGRAQRSERLGRLWIFNRFGPLLRFIFGRRARSPRSP
jgi:predicted Ser/Thr protein kinase